LIAHRDVREEVVARVAARAEKLALGDPTLPSTDIGPVIDAHARDRIDGMVRAAIDEGATLVTGGRPLEVSGCDGGAFYTPTILTGVARAHRIAREEVFGPVLSVIDVDGFDEAIDVVNESAYGLSAAIYTRDINLAMRATQRIDTGIVYVNAPTIGAEIQLPFGGTKHTGNGYREAGRRGIEQFSETKTVYIDYSGRLQRAQIDNRPPVEGA
jgi:aldehyde dehydrogenase (NAD+)